MREPGLGGPYGLDDNSFATTRWSIVLAAGHVGGDRDGARSALESLCRQYWFPLYEYVRRQGYDADAAQDLVQGFLAELIEHNLPAAADRNRGKFRSFLLAALKHYLSNQRERDRAQKRGGGVTPVSIDSRSAEERFGVEPAHDLTPERLFERQWALTLLENSVAQLRHHYEQDGRGAIFEQLKRFLAGGDADVGYREVGVSLGMSEDAVKVAVHRLRRRYRDVLREQVAQTLSTGEAIDDEIRDLFDALAV
jgi:RNA polymerase sigma-70 factor (ECF subfamily)